MFNNDDGNLVFEIRICFKRKNKYCGFSSLKFIKQVNMIQLFMFHIYLQYFEIKNFRITSICVNKFW